MKIFLQSRVLRPASAAKSGTMMAASENLAYGYNARSELVSAASDTDANYNYAYAFDHIGNRATEAVAGTENAYATNSLNQYTEICSAEPNQQTAEPSNQPSSLQFSYDADGNATQVQRLPRERGLSNTTPRTDQSAGRTLRRERLLR
ncbi:MAG: hypothetical protein IKW49_04260 [Opitutales bacterium]|nr:hypothetical protein [Opitutales bacterium]